MRKGERKEVEMERGVEGKRTDREIGRNNEARREKRRKGEKEKKKEGGKKK